ncbi:MAG: hypothetical protein LBD50_02690 [Rickettsiales bacterium]|nr:hypothetical protein [Rickettsiales bacterium]
MGQMVSDITDVLNNKKAKAAAESERKKILAQIAEDEKSKVNLVKKTLAAQRAKYGASGMSGSGMTENAVLKRMREETQEPFDEKKKTNLDKLGKTKAAKTNLLKSLISRFDELLG